MLKIKSIAYQKSLDFSIRVVNLYKYLKEKKKEYIISKQLMRCGTSVGANLAEAINGQSKKDFIAKIYISLKEASETEYWLELLYRTEYLTSEEYQSLKNDISEISRMLTATIKTAKKTNKS